MLAIPQSTELDPALTLGLVLLACFIGMGGLIVFLAGRLRHHAESLDSLSSLDDIDSLLRKMAARGEELDLRRIEHVLIDIRDAQARLEERLARQLDSSAPEGGSSGLQPAGLSERVVTRLISLGFERIEILTAQEDLEAISLASEGEVIVEARRGGALHKGRVLVRDSSICDVRLRSSYEAFP